MAKQPTSSAPDPEVKRRELLQQIIDEALEGWQISKKQGSSMSPHPKPEFLQVALEAGRALYDAAG